MSKAIRPLKATRANIVRLLTNAGHEPCQVVPGQGVIKAGFDLSYVDYTDGTRRFNVHHEEPKAVGRPYADPDPVGEIITNKEHQYFQVLHQRYTLWRGTALFDNTSVLFIREKLSIDR